MASLVLMTSEVWLLASSELVPLELACPSGLLILGASCSLLACGMQGIV